MDHSRFDVFSRAFAAARSRRGMTRLLSGLLLGGSVALRNLPLTEAKGKKKGGKKRRKKRSTATNPPPPPPPLVTCLDLSRPNVCARTNSCLPTCAPDKSFDPATCRCLCLERQACCECFGGANPPLCLEVLAASDAEDCQNFCEGQGLTSSRFVSDGRAECRTPGATTCTTICSDDP